MGSPMAEIDTSYRTPRHRPGMDPNTRRLGIIAGSIGGALLVMVGAWSLTGGKSGGVPVVEADARPLRIKPESSQQGPDLAAPATSGRQALAPTPEAPKPEALRAQAEKAAAEKLAADRQAAEKAAAERAPLATATPATATPATAPPVVSTAQVTAPVLAPGRPAGQPVALTAPIAPAPPAPQAARPAPAAAQVARPAPAPAPVAGGTQVQLAAVGSESAALSEWSRLEKRMPDVLGGRRPAVIRFERDGKTIWRLRTGGFVDSSQARGFCDRVRAKGGTCTVASF